MKSHSTTIIILRNDNAEYIRVEVVYHIEHGEIEIESAYVEEDPNGDFNEGEIIVLTEDEIEANSDRLFSNADEENEERFADTQRELYA